MENVKRFISQRHAFLFAVLLGFMLFVGQSGVASAAPNITFTATDVQCGRGATDIEGYFFNSGDTGATVSAAELSVEITDDDGNYVWADSSAFPSVGVYVAPGAQHWHVFRIHNANAPGYNGRIKWHVENHIYW